MAYCNLLKLLEFSVEEPSPRLGRDKKSRDDLKGSLDIHPHSDT